MRGHWRGVAAAIELDRCAALKVTSSKANAEDDRSVRIDIKGSPAALCGNPALFPTRAMSGGSLVAGVRYSARPTISPFSYWRAA
ncbi:hypothetical protein CWO90_14595 [Bradyrhizobium sp. Leo121]|nr:hypothetical protein CWO90_14595 [Bradyrhizobium sp. Leo121]